MAQIRGIGIPFPQQAPANSDGVLCLPSGGIYMPPPGQYVAQLGPQSNLQWFDPNQQAWRTLQPSDAMNMISCDGSNYRIINMSGVVIGAGITNAGSGGTNGIGAVATGVTVTLGTPVAGGALAAATMYPIVGGSVQAPTIVQGGSGFLVPPLILIDTPPVGGVQATATSTINSAGVVTAITMQNVGAGYTASPSFYVLPQPPNSYNAIAGVAAGQFPPPGTVYPTNLTAGSVFQQNISLTGCQLTSNALTGSGALTGLAILNYGFGYDGTHIPAITIAGCGAAAATAVMSMCVTGVTLGAGGSGFGSGAAPNWETSLGAVLLGTQQLNNQVALPRAARGVTTLAGGAVSTFVVEDPGFGLQKVPTVGVLSTSAIPSTVATGTAVCGGVVDYSVLQGRVQ
jgi:hypothetical protein